MPELRKQLPHRRDMLLNDDDHSAFYQEGEYWTIAFCGAVFRLRDSKGLHCLAHLLRHPGRQFAALELLEVPAPPASDPQALRPSRPHAPSADPEDARVVVTKRIKAAVKKIQAHHPALGYHLSTTVKTGTVCAYLPDPERPIAWTE